jgi:PmbA protein
MVNNFIDQQRVEYFNKIAAQVCESASGSGASASVSISYTAGHDLAVANSEVESLEFKGGLSLDINWYYQNKYISYSGSNVDEVRIRKAVESLQKKINFLEEDKFSGLPDANLLAFEYHDYDLYYDWSDDTHRQIELAKECEDYALSYDSRISQCESVNLSANKSYYLQVNTLGLNASYISSYYSMSCCLLTKDKDGSMHRDYDYTMSRNPKNMSSVITIAENSAKKTISRLGARTIKSQKSRILFSPRMARTLVSCFLSAISGSNIYRKSSFLCDYINKDIFPDFVNILDDPTIKGALASSYFDSEGVATIRKYLVKDGCLKSYLLSSYSARKLGLQSTGNAGGSHNVCVSKSCNDNMIEKLGTGLYVTDMMGQGLNILTGDFSKGVFGYWVENGKILFPVHEVTIAANLLDVYKNLIAIGNDIDEEGSIHTGSWLVETMTIAGN